MTKIRLVSTIISGYNVTMKKEHIEEIHYIRAFAFLAVVLQHAIGHYIFVPEANLADGVAFTFLLLLSKFAVPMFIFVTGLVLFYNYDGRLNYWTFIKKRFSDIMMPYLFWSFVYLLFQNHMDVLSAVNRFGEVFLTGKASYHLWYVIMIIQLYITFPIYRYIIMQAKRWISTPIAVYSAFAVLGIVYIVLMTYPIHVTAARWNIPLITPILTKYADRNALNFFYYFVLGALAGLTITNWRAWLNRHAKWIYSIFIVMSGVMAYRTISSFELLPALKTEYSQLLLLRPVTAIFLVSSVFATYLFCMRISSIANNRTRRIVTFISHYSYGAYLVHAFVLGLSYWLPDYFTGYINVTLRTIIAFIFASFLSVMLTYVLSKLPMGHIMTGLRKPQSKTAARSSTSQ
ncbi:acyltransferase [Paenibacillus sp. SC116]|uniref:acyltransferase n=1 Tax=Paenibacillus sp. SC116 TaxID=2968986 RepID=UPI00215AC2B3|nr:acyltransferase [Paenibacillus sp. SC116]MCR8842171.1 acyltransferase [Paenibacillus sp. SC116]